MNRVSFRDVVSAEFARRRANNPRYSLRGFARTLGVHHATVSRLLRMRGPVQSHTIAAIGKRLGLSSVDLQEWVVREDIAAVTKAIRRPSFQPNSRWLASAASISIDRVNVALQALLCSGELRMLTPSQWMLIGSKGVQ